MRDRSWRRYKEEVKVIHRLKSMSRRWRIKDANGVWILSHVWVDAIGTSQHYMYKTYTTKFCDSRYKSKWGKSGHAKYFDGMNRVRDKIIWKKRLYDEYGIKHFNISYGFINTEDE